MVNLSMISLWYLLSDYEDITFIGIVWFVNISWLQLVFNLIIRGFCWCQLNAKYRIMGILFEFTSSSRIILGLLSIIGAFRTFTIATSLSNWSSSSLRIHDALFEW